MKLEILKKKNGEYSISFSKCKLSDSYETDNVFIAFCGRLYELRDKNPAIFFYNLSINFKETLAEQLDGYYGVIIFNKKTGNLEIFRDPIGLQPLYYYSENEKIIFTESFNKLVSLIKPKKFCEEFFLLYLESAVPETFDLTLFEDIKRIPPNSIIFFEDFKLSSSSELFDFKTIQTISRTDKEAVSLLSENLKGTIKKISENQEKIIAQHTGGLDSTGIVAISKHLYGNGRIETYVLQTDSDDIGFDELAIVKRLHKEDHLPMPKVMHLHYNEITKEHLKYCKERNILNIINQTYESILKDIHKMNGEALFSGFGGDECITYNQPPRFVMNQIRKLRVRAFANSIKLYGLKRILSHIIRVELKNFFLGIFCPKKMAINSFNFRNFNFGTDNKTNEVLSLKEHIINMIKGVHVPYRIEEEKEAASFYNLEVFYPWLDFKLIVFFLSLEDNQIIKNRKGREIYKDSINAFLQSKWYKTYTKSQSVNHPPKTYDDSINKELCLEISQLPEFIKRYHLEEKSLALPYHVKKLLNERVMKINYFFNTY